MPGMQDRFDAGLEAAFNLAGADRNKVEAFKDQVRQRPPEAAEVV